MSFEGAREQPETTNPQTELSADVKKEIVPDPLPEPKGLAAILGDVYFVKEEKPKSVIERAKDEVDFYRSESPVDLKDCPLTWWGQHQHRMPVLANFAKKILCIPATSVPSERVFSTAGGIVTSQRASISSENVDMLIFLKKNFSLPKPSKGPKSS